MVLNLLTTKDTQLQSTCNLDLLTRRNGLPAKLNAFLLSGKVEGLSPATLKNYSYHLEAFVRFCSRANLNDAEDITAHHVRLFLFELKERNKPVSIVDYYKSTKRFFNWLVEEDLLEQTPMRTVKSPRVPKVIIRPFSDDAIKRLLALCSGERFLDYRNRALILLFLDTGLRLSEIANITLNNIDIDNEAITVMGKGAKERVVRIGKGAQKALLRYLLLRQDDYDNLWLTEERKPMSRDGIQSAVERLCRRVEIADAKPGPHTFRHTFAIKYLRNGGDVFTLQYILGHSTLEMTKRYVGGLGLYDMIKAHKSASPVDNMKLS